VQACRALAGARHWSVRAYLSLESAHPPVGLAVAGAGAYLGHKKRHKPLLGVP